MNSTNLVGREREKETHTQTDRHSKVALLAQVSSPLNCELKITAISRCKPKIIVYSNRSIAACYCCCFLFFRCRLEIFIISNSNLKLLMQQAPSHIINADSIDLQRYYRWCVCVVRLRLVGKFHTSCFSAITLDII